MLKYHKTTKPYVKDFVKTKKNTLINKMLSSRFVINSKKLE